MLPYILRMLIPVYRTMLDMVVELARPQHRAIRARAVVHLLIPPRHGDAVAAEEEEVWGANPPDAGEIPKVYSNNNSCSSNNK